MATNEERERIEAYFRDIGVTNAYALDQLMYGIGGYPTLSAIKKYPPAETDWVKLGFTMIERARLVHELPTREAAMKMAIIEVLHEIRDLMQELNRNTNVIPSDQKCH